MSTEDQKDAANRAIDAAGGPTLLAKQLSVKPNLVVHWRRTRIPAKYALEVAVLSGIPAHELRPDDFRLGLRRNQAVS